MKNFPFVLFLSYFSGAIKKIVVRKSAGPLPWRPVLPCFLPCYFSQQSPTSPHSDILSQQQVQLCRGNLLQCTSPCHDSSLKVYQALNFDEGSVVSLYEAKTEPENFMKLNHQMYFQKDYPIFDLQCHNINHSNYMLTRGMYRLDLHKLSAESLEYCNAIPESEASVRLTSASLCPSFEGLWLEANAKHRISLHSSARKNSCIQSTILPNHDKVITENEWSCSVFASNEENVCISANSASVYSWDFRKTNLDEMYNITKGREGEQMDEIIGLVPVSNRPYLFVIMAEQIMLLDRRSCMLPVLSWNHMLLDLPRFSSLQCLPNLDVLMLSNRLERRIAFASIQDCTPLPETPDKFVKSPSLISHADIFQPMKTLAHRNDLWFDSEVTDRFQNSFNSGLTSFSSEDGKKFSVISSNEMGDMFFQTFDCREQEQDAPLDSDFGEQVIKELKWFQESVLKDTECELDENTANYCITSKLQGLLAQEHIPLEQNSVWKTHATIDSYKQCKDYIRGGRGKAAVRWVHQLATNYKTRAETPTDDESNQENDVIKKHFHPDMANRMSLEWITSRIDSVALRVLDSWPISRSSTADNNLNFGNNEGDQIYRSLPYSSKYGKANYISKISSRSSNYSSSLQSSNQGSRSGDVKSSGPKSSVGHSSDVTVGSSNVGRMSTRDPSVTSALLRLIRGPGTPVAASCTATGTAASTASSTAAVPDAGESSSHMPGVSSTPVPSSLTHLLTPRFNRTLSGVSSTAKKKRKRNDGF